MTRSKAARRDCSASLFLDNSSTRSIFSKELLLNNSFASLMVCSDVSSGLSSRVCNKRGAPSLIKNAFSIAACSWVLAKVCTACSSESGVDCIVCTRDKIVGNNCLGLPVQSTKIVSAGGSSSILRSAFWASVLIVSASFMRMALLNALVPGTTSFINCWISRTASMPIELGVGLIRRMYGCDAVLATPSSEAIM